MRPYMTEEEAKGRGCPLRKWTNIDAVNGLHTDDEMMRCKASECMWWGWQHEEEFVGGVLVNGARTELGRCEAPGGVA